MNRNRITSDDTDSLGKCLKHWRLQKGLSLESIALKTRIPLRYLRALDTNDFSALPPLDTWPRTLGDSLRQYREQQGLSLDRIADRTRVPLIYLKALEENNALQMPAAPVIARSFIDAYLNCLALEDAQKEDLLVQYAKLAEAVYDTPPEVPAGQSAHVSDETEPSSISSGAGIRNRSHECVLAAYLATIEQRARMCGQVISGYRATLLWSRHTLHRIGIASTEAGQAAYQIGTLYAERLWTNARFDKEWSLRWQHALNTLSSGSGPIRHSFTWVQRSMPYFSNWHPAHASEGKGQVLSPADSHATHEMVKTGENIWGWMVRHGFTVLFFILLGGIAGNIPALKDTMLAGTRLTVAHLVEFFSYGAALIMVGGISRNIARRLDRDRSGLAFLRPLVTPMTVLLIVSVLNKILLIVMNPFFSKSDRLAYNWTFVVLILVSTLWIVLAWFFRSAPILESLSTPSRDHPSSDDVTSSTCPHCNASVPPGMKFCGQCGGALTALQS